MYSLRQLCFSQLLSKVASATRHRIQNGEFTERGLARLAGISQPHLHNVLKGVREMTPSVGDALLIAMDIGLLDIVDPEDLAQAVEALRASASNSRVIPVLRGRIGPGFPIPDPRLPGAWRPLPSGLPISARRPAIVLLGSDPHLSAIFPAANTAVIDLDDLARLRPVEPYWYVVRHSSGGLIRQVRLRDGRLEILGQLSLVDEAFKPDLPLGSNSLLRVVRARVIWVGQNLEWPLTDTGSLPSL